MDGGSDRHNVEERLGPRPLFDVKSAIATQRRPSRGHQDLASPPPRRLLPRRSEPDPAGARVGGAARRRRRCRHQPRIRSSRVGDLRTPTRSGRNHADRASGPAAPRDRHPLRVPRSTGRHDAASDRRHVSRPNHHRSGQDAHGVAARPVPRCRPHQAPRHRGFRQAGTRADARQPLRCRNRQSVPRPHRPHSERGGAQAALDAEGRRTPPAIGQPPSGGSHGRLLLARGRARARGRWIQIPRQPAAFERDRRRDQRLAAAGFQVIRITWRQLEAEPMAVLARLAQALALRAA
jgi:hypothetical protein